MKRVALVIALIFLMFITQVITVYGQPIKDIKDFKTESHVIILAKDNDTEVDITVDGEQIKTMYLQAGINYLCYETDIKPDIEILVYGDTIKLKMTEGRGQDWYTFCRIAPPEDGDGERTEK